jgi:hypothetical protein
MMQLVIKKNLHKYNSLCYFVGIFAIYLFLPQILPTFNPSCDKHFRFRNSGGSASYQLTEAISEDFSRKEG